MYFKPDIFVVRTNETTYVDTTISCIYTYTHACLRMAMPTTNRTNDHTTQSLALTNKRSVDLWRTIIFILVYLSTKLVITKVRRNTNE